MRSQRTRHAPKAVWVAYVCAVAAVLALGVAYFMFRHESSVRPLASSDATTTTTQGALGAGPGGSTRAAPDLGDFTDPDTLIAALRASGPLDNEGAKATAAGTAPGLSICAAILRNREPAAGEVVHEAQAGYRDDRGVLFVLRREDGSEEARLYSIGAADPVTGGCRLLVAQAL